MRIITGKAKGINLKTLEGDSTRPTSQRVKEAVFSMLQFDVEGRRVLDLFAGSGQMGLEAISRGADSAVLVDKSLDAVKVINYNVVKTKFIESVDVRKDDYISFLNRYRGDKFDIVFIDPPYAMECCKEALLRLADSELIIPGAIIVLESGEEEPDFSDREDIEVLKSTHYGKKTFVNILLYGTEVEA